MIKFHVEWLDAPGVRDAVLARTWARLVIEANGRLVTEVVDQRADSRRGSVYGTVFPLCRWIVENWWFLLNESYPFPAPYSSLDLARRPSDRAWVQRHSMLTAREGGALPDLTIHRDGKMVVARWVPDRSDESLSPIRFTGSGEVRMDPEQAAQGLGDVVRLVLDRLDGLQEPDAMTLRANLVGVSAATVSGDRALCEWSARLGLDPHDPNELTDALANELVELVDPLDSSVRYDLLDVADAGGLEAGCRWIQHAQCVAAEALPATIAAPSLPSPSAASAHELGYRSAALVRDYLSMADGQGPVEDIDDTLLQLGWARCPEGMDDPWPGGPLYAMVERSGAGDSVAVTPEFETRAKRFSQARALFLRYANGTPWDRRLATRAHTWDQRASRAFAAEFLAPADGISRSIGEYVSPSQIDDLADHYGVQPVAIRHQIENHRLGWVSDF